MGLFRLALSAIIFEISRWRRPPGDQEFDGRYNPNNGETPERHDAIFTRAKRRRHPQWSGNTYQGTDETQERVPRPPLGYSRLARCFAGGDLYDRRCRPNYLLQYVEFAGRTPEIGSDQWCVTWRLYWPDGRPMGHDECPMARALKEDRAIVGCEAIAERPDGTRVPFMAYPTPLHDASGRFVGAVNMLVDLTAAKEVDEARSQLNEMLEERV